jgi:hypothetical protein
MHIAYCCNELYTSVQHREPIELTARFICTCVVNSVYAVICTSIILLLVFAEIVYVNVQVVEHVTC